MYIESVCCQMIIWHRFHINCTVHFAYQFEQHHAYLGLSTMSYLAFSVSVFLFAELSAVQTLLPQTTVSFTLIS